MSTIINIQKASTIKVNGTHINGNSKAVFCITTGQFFGSLSDAAHSVKGSIGTMCCAMKHRNGVYKNMKWCYVCEIQEHLEEIATDIRANIEKAIAYDTLMAKKEEATLANHEATIEDLRKQIDELNNKLLTEIYLASEATERINTMKEEFWR